MTIENITNKLFSMNFSFTNAELVEISVVIIGASVLIVLIGLAVYFIKNKKTKEEKVASKIVKKINQIEEGKIPSEQPSEIKKDNKKNNASEISLKEMLVKKFQPIIENQLKSEIEINGFEVQGDNFKVRINVQGNNLDLILDSSGKIIDYKKI